MGRGVDKGTTRGETGTGRRSDRREAGKDAGTAVARCGTSGLLEEQAGQDGLLSSCLIQIPITHAFHAVANRDGHIGRGDLADRTNKY